MEQYIIKCKQCNGRKGPYGLAVLPGVFGLRSE